MTVDTSAFFNAGRTVSAPDETMPMDQWGRYKLPDADGVERGWTRVTTFAETLCHKGGLHVWRERQVALGLGRRPDLLALASTITGPEDKQALREIVEGAHAAAETEAGANTGTALHNARRNKLLFGTPPPDRFAADLAAYERTLAEHGLTPVPGMVERVVIVPEYHLAGRFDEIVSCPDGKLRMSDTKSGKLEEYHFLQFAIQVACYAHASAIWDEQQKRYVPMPPIERDYAYLVHIRPDSGQAEVYRVNIQQGWAFARLCAEVRDAREVKHLITPAPLPATWADQQHTHAASTPAAMSAQAYVRHVPAPPPIEQLIDHTQPAHAFPPGLEHQVQREQAVPDSPVLASGVNPFAQPAPVPPANGYRYDVMPPGTSTATPPLAGPVPTEVMPDPRPATEDTSAFWQDVNSAPAAGSLPHPVIGGPMPASQPESTDAPTGEAADRVPDFDAMATQLVRVAKGKADVQERARKYLAANGLPADAIKLQTTQIKIARALVELAHQHGDELEGVPLITKPAEGSTKPPAAPASAPGGPPIAPQSEPAATVARENYERAVIGRITVATNLNDLTELRRSIGADWTEAMQAAVVAKAQTLGFETGQPTPLMDALTRIEQVTKKQQLSEIWQDVTNQRQNLQAWTQELQTAAQLKLNQLNR